MYSFYNGGLSNHFDNYFAEIASVHKYQTRLASLQKYYLTRMKTSLGQLSLKYIGRKIWSNIPENFKSSSPYSFGKKYKQVQLSCKTSCWSSFYVLVTFCNIALMPLFSLLSTSIVTHSTPVHRHAFHHCFFVVVFMLILFDVDLMLFITFITSCKTSSIKIWFVQAAGLAETWPRWSFANPLW